MLFKPNTSKKKKSTFKLVPVILLSLLSVSMAILPPKKEKENSAGNTNINNNNENHQNKTFVTESKKPSKPKEAREVKNTNKEKAKKSRKDSETKGNKEIKKTKKTKKTKDTKNKKEKTKLSTKTILARITVYWARGTGTDKWSSKNMSSTGTKLQCGKHAAVDPKVIPYGSKLKVKKGKDKITVKAVDTGGDVKKRRAAIAMGKTPQQKKAPVIDLFFQNKTAALAYAHSNPPFQWVEISYTN